MDGLRVLKLLIFYNCLLFSISVLCSMSVLMYKSLFYFNDLSLFVCRLAISYLTPQLSNKCSEVGYELTLATFNIGYLKTFSLLTSIGGILFPIGLWWACPFQLHVNSWVL